jgi:hypothetical protein
MLCPYPECHAESLIALNILGVLVDQHTGRFLAAQLDRQSSSTSAVHPPSAKLVCCLELIVNILVRDWTCH